MRYAADTDGYAKQLEALFTTLRLLSVLDMEALIESADVTDRVLTGDPTGEYARMDAGTKQAYLRRVEQLARRADTEEHIYARAPSSAARRTRGGTSDFTSSPRAVITARAGTSGQMFY